MNTKHTPGPWNASTKHRAALNGWVSFVVQGPDGKSVACATSNTTRNPAEIQANGQLIAEAPAMLAALRIVAACVADEQGGTTLGSWEMGKVRELLARIDGAAR